MNLKRIAGTAAVWGIVFSGQVQAAFTWEDYYEIETIDMPEGVDPQIGGIDSNASGQLVVCFHRGEVMVYDEASQEWSTFARGLHEPLGVFVEEAGTILVVQRSELTRLHDRDGDGVADFYELVSNDWGMTGNYHEFAFGPVKDSQGNVFLSLGTASHLAGIRDEIRGEWNDAGGLTMRDFRLQEGDPDWKEKKENLPRMYARVPYRGCVLKIEPGSRKAEVFATGLRTPNGLFVDAKDQLWVSDNQGDWVGASKLHLIREGGFYGHAASLLWSDNPPDAIPANLPVETLESLRTKAAALMPQGDCANSPTQILEFRNSFGASRSGGASGQLILGDMNHSRLIHYYPDEVGGQLQGTSTHLLDTQNLGMGNNRLLYSKDGRTLYLGKTHLSWPGREGMKRVTYNGKPYLQVDSVRLTPSGFEFTFNDTIAAPTSVEDYEVEAYRIAYHSSYGSKKYELETVPCSRISVEGKVLRLELKEKPVANRVYDIRLPQEISSSLSAISSHRFWYTAHEVY
ncbi:hypothetical protein [Pelagicoccus sp. SDUM812005]|uniref:hypothetical protein n=1 Tax=Pelagicoccus sp. SDUM812005 TaxID=3041257 RepID=UPI00280F54D4|nr:hypothetical protein [Pelagicoccus sp. SDUM812005]MDQ8183298.1 hypothetical protein [Pelagicoccus sp. SDUM812005]